ncbi:hypothetical protein CDD82_4885 [Ophiocordyceps australis]|uniref:Uncharacterized protein n=1 Tax=Ophiocordyceps australis TaxID=1399860 RepID=A0A2C5Z3X0_9HYPO|nr:hypothetical protein CDD82_4885 [Ophiocordyceps australis]
MAPPQQYLTLTLKGLGFSTFHTNLLAIPYTMLHIMTMLGLTYLSEATGQLALVALLGQVWAFPLLVYLNVVNTASTNKWVMWTVITVLLGYPEGMAQPPKQCARMADGVAAHAIQVGWASRNANSVRTRTVSAACYNMFVQGGSIVSANIYRQDDAPRFVRGNRQLLAILCLNIAIYMLVKLYYVSRNRQRARKWHAMTEHQRLHYLATTTDQGSKRLDFRFDH